MLHVSCAIIENGDKILLTQRSEIMSHPLQWEFPGGKLHKGETAWESLVRELDEELNLEINKVTKLPTYTFEYPDFTICLHPFVCSASGKMVLHEHKDARFLSAKECQAFKLSGADVGVLKLYLDWLDITD